MADDTVHLALFKEDAINAAALGMYALLVLTVFSGILH